MSGSCVTLFMTFVLLYIKPKIPGYNRGGVWIGVIARFCWERISSQAQSGKCQEGLASLLAISQTQKFLAMGIL